mgnify:CR=1 FL=1
MPTIIFETHDGNKFEAEAEAGTSVMQAAVDAGIDGILGECGGACSCATCHCYVEGEWVAKVNPAEELEKDMLDCVLEPTEFSRLSCQIIVTDEHDQLVVKMPESQY